MRRALAQRLEAVEGFADPRVDLEQYPTPADLAAHVVHLADLQGDLSGTVVDLGTGTGVLALGAATRGPERVVGVDVDAGALAIARANEERVGPATRVEWVRGDATRPPISRPGGGATALMNPPFGAQRGNRHADRAFLRAAADLAAVSYSVHNEGSREFVASFAGDAGGEVTHAFRAAFALDRQFDFHRDAARDLDVEVYRIEWGPTGARGRDYS